MFRIFLILLFMYEAFACFPIKSRNIKFYLTDCNGSGCGYFYFAYHGWFVNSAIRMKKDGVWLNSFVDYYSIESYTYSIDIGDHWLKDNYKVAHFGTYVTVDDGLGEGKYRLETKMKYDSNNKICKQHYYPGPAVEFEIGKCLGDLKVDVLKVNDKNKLDKKFSVKTNGIHSNHADYGINPIDSKNKLVAGDSAAVFTTFKASISGGVDRNIWLDRKKNNGSWEENLASGYHYPDAPGIRFDDAGSYVSSPYPWHYYILPKLKPGEYRVGVHAKTQIENAKHNGILRTGPNITKGCIDGYGTKTTPWRYFTVYACFEGYTSGFMEIKNKNSFNNAINQGKENIYLCHNYDTCTKGPHLPGTIWREQFDIESMDNLVVRSNYYCEDKSYCLKLQNISHVIRLEKKVNNTWQVQKDFIKEFYPNKFGVKAKAYNKYYDTWYMQADTGAFKWTYFILNKLDPGEYRLVTRAKAFDDDCKNQTDGTFGGWKYYGSKEQWKYFRVVAGNNPGIIQVSQPMRNGKDCQFTGFCKINATQYEWHTRWNTAREPRQFITTEQNPYFGIFRKFHAAYKYDKGYIIFYHFLEKLNDITGKYDVLGYHKHSNASCHNGIKGDGRVAGDFLDHMYWITHDKQLDENNLSCKFGFANKFSQWPQWFAKGPMFTPIYKNNEERNLFYITKLKKQEPGKYTLDIGTSQFNECPDHNNCSSSQELTRAWSGKKEFTVRPSKIILRPTRFEQNSGDVVDLEFQAVGKIPSVTKIHFARITVEDENNKSVKKHIYVNNEGGALDGSDNAKENGIKFENNKFVIKNFGLPFNTKAKIRLSAISYDDPGMCKAFDADKTTEIELNTPDEENKIYCQVPVCFEINGAVKCGVDLDYAFKSQDHRIDLHWWGQKDYTGLFNILAFQGTQDEKNNIERANSLEIKLNYGSTNKNMYNYLNTNDIYSYKLRINLLDNKTKKILQADKYGNNFKDFLKINTKHFNIVSDSACGGYSKIVNNALEIKKCFKYDYKTDEIMKKIDELNEILEKGREIYIDPKKCEDFSRFPTSSYYQEFRTNDFMYLWWNKADKYYNKPFANNTLAQTPNIEEKLYLNPDNCVKVVNKCTNCILYKEYKKITLGDIVKNKIFASSVQDGNIKISFAYPKISKYQSFLEQDPFNFKLEEFLIDFNKKYGNRNIKTAKNFLFAKTGLYFSDLKYVYSDSGEEDVKVIDLQTLKSKSDDGFNKDIVYYEIPSENARRYVPIKICDNNLDDICFDYSYFSHIIANEKAYNNTYKDSIFSIKDYFLIYTPKNKGSVLRDYIKFENENDKYKDLATYSKEYEFSILIYRNCTKEEGCLEAK